MPITAQLDTGAPGAPLPLEGDDESKTAGLTAAANAAFTQTLGVTAIEKGLAAVAGGPMISQADAQAKMKAQGYDASGIPEGGVTAGALDVMMHRQSDIKTNENIAQRANLSGASRFAASIVGGLPDPTNLAFGALGKLAAPVIKGGLAVRAVGGAAEGAVYTSAQTYGTQEIGKGLGDADQSSLDNLRTVLFGSIIGGGLHVGLGGKAPVVKEVPGPADLREQIFSQVGKAEDATGTGVITHDTGGLTKFGISQKAHPDVDVANLTQEKATAILKSDYWDKIDGDKLPANIAHTAMDAAVNQGVDNAKAWLKESGGDPEKFNQLREAQYRKLAAENPEKYGKYLDGWLSRLQNVANEPILAQDAAPRVASVDQMGTNVDQLPPETRQAALETAVNQFKLDDDVNVDQVINKSLEEQYGVKPNSDFDPTGGDNRTGPRNALTLADEHAAEVQRIETEAFSRADPRRFQGADTDLSKAVPVPGRALVTQLDQDRIAAVKTAVATSAEAPADKGGNAAAVASAEGPLTTEAKASMTDAVKEAEAFHDNTRGPYVPDEKLTPAQNEAARVEHEEPQTAFEKEMAGHDEAISAHEEFAKSVEAAVRCAANLGVD